jgi:LuxR family maltose regulon positive regulatory protein
VARPFRFKSPEPGPGLVLRTRVQQALSGRFERQVTVLVAGAGFGKTSALVQAFDESRLRSLGTDHWLAFEPDDADIEHALAGLCAALGVEAADDAEDFVDRAIEFFSAGAPSRQCLVLDDVHHIPPGSATAAVLDRLLVRLPANASLVLSGRRRPPLALRRLELTGECVVIDEATLAFEPDEVAAVAAQAGTSATLAIEDLAGWPALVRLSLAHDEPASFVVEEVLDVLDEVQTELLRSLLVVGEGEPDVLAATAGVASAAALDGVPLVSRRDGRFGAHDLWATMLVDDGRDTQRRRRAMDVLIARGDAPAAIEVGLRAREPAAVGEPLVAALRAALLVTAVPAGRDLRRWQAALPADLADQPAAVLLDGLIARLDNPGSEVCHELLQRAAEMFLDDGDTRAAVAALSALTFALHVRRDRHGLITAFGKLSDLADAGEKSARPYQLLARAIVATSSGDSRAVIDHTADLLNQQLSDDTRAVALWMRANALNNMGHDATAEAAECVSYDLPLPGISFIHFGARFRAGHIAELRSEPHDLPAGERDRFLLATWMVLLTASMGDHHAARGWLKILDDSAGDVSQWQTAGSILLPRATALLSFGDTEAAKELLSEMRALHHPDGQALGYYLHAVPLYYPLFPDIRGWYDEQGGLGPQYERDLRLNQALVGVVEEGNSDAARSVELPGRVGELIPSLGLRNAITLLSACFEVGHPDAEQVISDLIELAGERAREVFREAAESDVDVVAAGARSVIELMPVRPPHAAVISVLGGSELRLGGELVESADWRRERVRALLTYLVLHRSTTREQATAALWPAAGASAAKRNLRSTLNVLNQVLEPERRGGDAPFFVRSFGQRLRLVSDEYLDVDVDRFALLADQAEALEAAGTPSLSIEPYLAAAQTYTGDLLPDSYDDWVVFARDRLRSRYVRVAVRCAELLTATGRAGEALDVVGPVLAIEPWAEGAHRVLIAAHLELGDVAAARRALDTCRTVLSELGGPAEPATHELERRLERV